MKTILFLVVLIGIAIVENSHESEKEITKYGGKIEESRQKSGDFVRSGGNPMNEHVLEKDSKRLLKGVGMNNGILDEVSEIFSDIPVNTPGGSMVTYDGLLENLLKDFNLAKFINCTLNQLQSNMDKCFRGLLLNGLNISSVYFNINALLFGINGRNDECTTCGGQDLDTQLTLLEDLCPLVANITYYLGCIVKETSKLSCFNYIGTRVQEILYVEAVSSGREGYNCITFGATSNEMISQSETKYECRKLGLARVDGCTGLVNPNNLDHFRFRGKKKGFLEQEEPVQSGFEKSIFEHRINPAYKRALKKIRPFYENSRHRSNSERLVEDEEDHELNNDITVPPTNIKVSKGLAEYEDCVENLRGDTKAFKSVGSLFKAVWKPVKRFLKKV
ncbi:uncharacterized protein [Centruroides vittatus]|uniref:uncharacterized protein n=1 Tax=Centruroides vittatus TaxID=120091 RepID=UPI0035103ABC